jgi:hypothetical protein
MSRQEAWLIATVELKEDHRCRRPSPRLQSARSCVLLSTARSKGVLLGLPLLQGALLPCFSARPFERSCCGKHSLRGIYCALSTGNLPEASHRQVD